MHLQLLQMQLLQSQYKGGKEPSASPPTDADLPGKVRGQA